MGKSNKYYLIARNRSDNDYDFVCFDGSLESIDLYTINFDNERELSNELYNAGKIRFNDVDLFIVFSKENNIITNEVLYSNSQLIKDIAIDSKNKELDISNKNVNSLLFDFCHRMGINSNYYDMVMYGDTNIYNKFVNYFIGKRFQNSYDLKYKDGCWDCQSYPLLRNIVESYARYNNPIDDYSIERRVLNDDLIRKINTNAVNNQLLLFDVLEFKKENQDNNNKLIKVLGVFDIVDSDYFLFNDDEAVFIGNDQFYFDLKQMNCLLDKDLMKTLAFYALHRNVFSKINENSDKYFRYKKLVREDKDNIYELLTKDSVKLDNAYIWCLLYIKYNFSLLGDDNGYQKEKLYDRIR